MRTNPNALEDILTIGLSGYSDSLLEYAFDGRKGHIKITKPDGSTAEQNGIAPYFIWCKQDSNPQGLEDCQTGTYTFEINADDVFKSQLKLSKTFTAQWDGMQWKIPKESQDIYCGPNSVIGHIQGPILFAYKSSGVIASTYYAKAINQDDVSILKNILSGESPMPSNICCIDADANGKFEQADIDMVQNFVDGKENHGNTDRFCSEIG